MQRLDKEKDEFLVHLKEYELRFEKIKLFDNIDLVNETAKETADLRVCIDNSRDKID